jgi:D-alanine-D-alanine ligase
MDQGPLDILQSSLNDFYRYEQELAILLIIHLQTDTVEDDYEEFSVVTSYYSDIEFQEILMAFKQIAAYVDVSYGEKEFIRKVQTGAFSHLDGYKKIAYSQTAGGTARSKSALIPAFCELYQIKYCCNDIFTGALLDNKLASNKLLKSLGMRIPDTWFYHHKTGWLGMAPPGGLVLIAKPAYECASIGVTENSVSQVNDSYLKFVHELSKRFRQPILVQSFIEGYEIEVPVFELESPIVPGIAGISLDGNENLGSKILSYHTIFDDGFDLYDFQKVNENVAKHVAEDTIMAYTLLQMKGPVRMDYRVTSAGDYYLMDYNNSPHLGKRHSFAFTIRQLGYTYEDMLRFIVYPSLIS